MTKANFMKNKFFSEGHKLPICINHGCNSPVCVREWKYWSFKSECGTCQKKRTDGQYTLNEDGERIIITKGREIVIHRREYCENEGELGFPCPVPRDGWIGFGNSLDLDHLDGNHENNTPENVKTYCKLCHGRKSIECGDTNSRKASARQIEESNTSRGCIDLLEDAA